MRVTCKSIRLFFTVLLLASTVPNLAAQRRWYKVTSPDKEFTVEFPSEPEYLYKPNPETGYGTGVFRMKNGNYAFEISYQEIILPLNTDDDIIRFLNMTKDWQRESWERANFVRTRLVDLLGGGYEADGHEHLSDGRPRYKRVRTYYRDRRLYVLTCTSWSPSGLGGQIVDRFLGSFRFINGRPRENRRE